MRLDMSRVLKELTTVPLSQHSNEATPEDIFYTHRTMQCLTSIRWFLCTTFLRGALGGQKRMSDPLELESWVFVSHYVGAKYRT